MTGRTTAPEALWYAKVVVERTFSYTTNTKLQSHYLHTLNTSSFNFSYSL